MAENGYLVRNIEMEATLTLLSAGYVFTSVRPEHILLAGRKDDWDVDSPRLQAVWSYFANIAIDIAGRFQLARSVLKQVWRGNSAGLKAPQVTERILQSLSSVEGGTAIIQGLLANADGMFPINVGNATAFKQTITMWLDREPRIIVP